MSHWILRESGAEKIRFLARAFYASKKIAFSKMKNAETESYCPFMGWESLCNEVIDSDLASLFCSNDSVLPKNPEYLKLLLEFYKKSQHTNMFKGTHVEPDPSLYQRNPENHTKILDGIRLLKSSTPWIRSLFDELVVEVLPIRDTSGRYSEMGGCSDPRLIGSIFIGVIEGENTEIDIALGLAHSPPRWQSHSRTESGKQSVRHFSKSCRRGLVAFALTCHSRQRLIMTAAPVTA